MSGDSCRSWRGSSECSWHGLGGGQRCRSPSPSAQMAPFPGMPMSLTFQKRLCPNISIWVRVLQLRAKLRRKNPFFFLAPHTPKASGMAPQCCHPHVRGTRCPMGRRPSAAVWSRAST